MTTTNALARARWIGGIVLIAAVASTGGTPSPARGETTAGPTAGAALGGDQDLGLNVIGGPKAGRRVVQHGMTASTGLLAGLAVTHWPESWRWFGVGVEGLFLDTPVRTRRGQDVAQTRSVMLVDLLGRHRIGSGGVFVYAGPTGGFAYTTVRRGGDAVGPAVGALSGVAVPLIPNLRLRFEVQYLVTHDVDFARTHHDRVDVSGDRRNNPANAIFGPHLDTQFLPLRVGLDWVFR